MEKIIFFSLFLLTHSPIILSSFEKISYCDIQFSKKKKKTGSLFPTMVVYHLEKEGL
ncbi:hypothetical protein HMPREF0841_1341 [Streptococcus pyogenes ATCC 10782]|nr:hypothetical protein HMPREF0841_1341 [Streptococcus pyogenes ATCC 10782]